ncbi:MAG: response regulator [Alteromonadaceae bacterium]|nr:response regulator [Alteromonadaceae bacterium]
MHRRLKTIIVDDESLARKLLLVTLAKMPELEIIAECQNGKEALAKATELTPDLMFLDIQMPGLNGIEVATSLQADIMPMIVFTTAYDKYAIEAFKLYAVDYLLKPIEEDMLQQSVERAMQRFTSEEDALRKPNITSAVHHLLTPQDQSKLSVASFSKLAIKDGKEIDMVDFEQIEWIDAAGDLMCVHSDGKTYLMRETMKNLMEQLNPKVFQRIHRSTIVNLSKIEKIVPHIKGEYFVFLTCGEKLKVSRSYKDIIKHWLASS